MGNVLNQLMSTYTTAMEHEMQVVVETCGLKKNHPINPFFLCDIEISIYKDRLNM